MFKRKQSFRSILYVNIVFVFVLLFFGLSILSTVNASSVPIYTEYRKLSDEKENISSFDSLNTFVPDLSESWSAVGDITDANFRDISGIRFYCADINTKNSTVSFSSEGCSFLFELSKTNIEINKYTSFYVGVTLRGGQSLSKSYPVEINIATTEETVTYYTYVHAVYSPSDMIHINVDLSSVKGEILTLSFNFQYNEENAPAQIRLSSPVFYNDTNQSFIMAGDLLASGFECSECSFDTVTKSITPVSSSFSLKAEYTGSLHSYSGKMYFFIKFASAPNGVLTFNVSSHDYADAGERKTETLRIPLSSDILTYAIPIDTKGYIESYSLEFSGISSENNRIILDSITSGMGSSLVLSEADGLLTSIKKDGNIISFSGTVDRTYIKENSDSEIVFLALYGDNEPIKLGSTKLTTKYDFSVDISDFDISSSTCKFTAAFMSPDGNLSIMSEPKYFDSTENGYIPTTKLGISGGTAAGAFEANASHYIVDIPLNELFSNETTGMFITTKAGDGSITRKYINKTLIDKIDNEINFCMSAGIRTYLRFISSEPVEGLTYSGLPADNYGIYLSNESYKQLYCSMISFLSERYPSIKGFVLGKDVLSVTESGASFSNNPISYSEALAEICRLTYNASSKTIPDILTLIPAGCSDENSLSVFNTVFSDCMNEVGRIPWILLCVANNFDYSSSPVEKSEKMLSAMNIKGFSEYMLYCTFDENYAAQAKQNGIDFADYLVAKIKEACTSSGKSRAVFVSLSDSSFIDDVTVYKVLQDTEESGGYVYEGTAIIDKTDKNINKYTVWDFKKTYYNPGFIAAGLDTLSSDYGRFTDSTAERVLRFKTPAADSGIGIILGTLENTTDLSSVSGVMFELAATCENPDDEIHLIFVFGTNDSRSEYQSTIKPDGKFHTYTCAINKDLPECATDFIGLMLYSDSACTGEISQISICSSDKDQNELKAVFFPEATQEESKDDTVFIKCVIGSLVLVITVVVVILLIKHDKETEEKENKIGKGSKNNGKQK